MVTDLEAAPLWLRVTWAAGVVAACGLVGQGLALLAETIRNYRERRR